MGKFTHLHVHSEYSILDGAASVSRLVKKAKGDGMEALALTDHGDMYGIKEFHQACKREGIKPLLGVETYMVDHRAEKDRSNHHLIMIAKNEKGYRNLLKMVSIANTQGYYYRPRIDRDTFDKYHEGIIVTTACLGGEVPQWIMKNNLSKAEETILWFKERLGDDFYLEVQRHPTNDPRLKENIFDNQNMVNKVLVELGKKHDVKVVATNDVHFVNEDDAESHDLLICMNTGKDYDDPNRMRYTQQEWFKTQDEMSNLFGDMPFVVENTQEVADKVEFFELNSAPIMPEFPIPESFSSVEKYNELFDEARLLEIFGEKKYNDLGGYSKAIRLQLESDYLDYLVIEGAKERYGDPLPDHVFERLEFELQTIKSMGFPGYFLIVQDFINAARKMGVLVGPGRGSAAGAAVSYCVGITNIDPIKYDLLFERFLNPDRISMPDVDIDFDDDGRQMVLDWVTDKYGLDKVAHICTFGTMAAKSSIKDVARVLRLDLSEANRLAKMVPEAPKMTLKKAYKENPELEKEKQSSNKLIAKTMMLAERLEGMVRQTGVHACGILIGRDPLEENIPVMPTKGEKLLTTQYDGRFVEDIGLLKMDFLGLKTLSIIKETLDNIKRSTGDVIDVDKIPMDDEKTFELFSKGETTAIFQFESPGMKKHLRGLMPNRFEDLVAMNALYRPGPMEYIPDYIARKHGVKEVVYDHPLMEKYLKETYGITVFQEQVMLLSRRLGNFTRGESDTLRKAMGKKNLDLMEKLKLKFMDGCKGNDKFMDGCKEKGITKNKDVEHLIEKIWKDWEAFASYAFNKSHSVCYAYIAYQTGYLKAHYPAEFMAGVLSRNLSDITKITTFMEECRRMRLAVKGPDVNESFTKFTVNKQGEIRFGMVGVKGVGAGAVENIIEVREEGGPYKDIFDFAERVNLRSVSKKNWEALAKSGGFDSMNIDQRSQFFAPVANEETSFIENLIRYGNKLQIDKAQQANSLFGMFENDIAIKKPDIPQVQGWSKLHQLNQEKELIGIYLSAHPLDDYRIEIEHFLNTRLNELDDLVAVNNKEIVTGGMVTAVRNGTTKKGNPFGILTVEDYWGSFEFAFFGNDYVDYSKYCQIGYTLLIKGRVQARRYDESQLEFKVKSMSLLSDVKESLINKITIDLPLETIDPAFVDDLAGSIDIDRKGGILLYVNIIDKEGNGRVQLFSRQIRMSKPDTLMNYLQEMEIPFKLNS